MSIKYWCLRQNPYANTDQNKMKEIIIDNNIITCPFGHVNEYEDNVKKGNFKLNLIHPLWSSRKQDQRFIEELQINDIIVIPFKNMKECLLVKVISEPLYDDLNLNISIDDNISKFNPVYRKVKIINDKLIFKDKRVLPRQSLCLINKELIN